MTELERDLAGLRRRLREIKGVAADRRPARELWNRLQSRAELLVRAAGGVDPQARHDALLVVRDLVERIEISRGRTARKPAIAVRFDEAALIAMALRDGPDADVLRRGTP